MKIHHHLVVTFFSVVSLLYAASASAATLLANYTLNFKPPSPNCATTALGDLSGATLSGALSFSFLDSLGAQQLPPGPPIIPGIACGGSMMGSFSFEVPDAGSSVFVSFGGDVVRPPGPPTLPAVQLPAVQYPTYAFAMGSDPASLNDPSMAPWIALPVSTIKPPNPNTVLLYAFSGGAYQMGSIDITLQAVPLPATTWLFGSGLLGFIGMARRKAA